MLFRSLILALFLPSVLFAANLREQVDALILARAEGRALAGPADDAEFLRRAWLDFDGGIPTAAEARAFLADPAPDKRPKLIEKLIAAPRFAQRMAEAFDVMLMERRGANEEWRKWLVEAFATNKPWDAMAREILAPDFLDEKQRGAGHFIVRRLEKVGQQETDYPGLTRDVGRLFMGVDLQCCQCHNHLTVKEYKQQDFIGLFTGFQNAKLQPPNEKYKTTWLSEGALTAKTEFVSVLTDSKGATAPRVPFGDEVEIPALSGDDVWLAKPDRKTKEVGVPKFSPLREMAARLPTPENALFARNIVNRVWWLLMGRGIVEPLDLHHAENPPSHPELLALLEKEFVARKFDLRWLIRELALTQTYQRAGSSANPGGADDPADQFLAARERHLTSEQHMRALLIATGEMERVHGNKHADPKSDKQRYTMAVVAKSFDAALANAAKEPELQPTPSLRSALFFRNSDPVFWAVKPRPGNLVERVQKLSDPAAMAEELYLSILTRRPDEEEAAAFAAWLQRPGRDRAQAVSDYAWALLSSSEWFVNH